MNTIVSYEEEIRSLLSDVSQVNDCYDEFPYGQMGKIEKSNPLDPYLLDYCFSHILGFPVRHRIFEKINYIITFKYKSSIARAEHRKLSYCIYISKEYRKEFTAILVKVKKVLSDLFLEHGKIALQKNEFTLENNVLLFTDKLSFYKNRINELYGEFTSIEQRCSEKRGCADGFDSVLVQWNEYNEARLDSKREMTYMIESYIDTFFSYLEHILVLLYPFVNDVSDESFYYKKIHNTRWFWSEKIKDIDKCDRLNSYVPKLRKIKEVYRNSNAHGLFSKEMMAYVQIPKYGRYPVYIGKEYLKGILDIDVVELGYKQFQDIDKLFDKFLSTLHDIHPIPMLFIDNGVCVPVVNPYDSKHIDSIEEADFIIRKYYYEHDNQINMDW